MLKTSQACRSCSTAGTTSIMSHMTPCSRNDAADVKDEETGLELPFMPEHRDDDDGGGGTGEAMEQPSYPIAVIGILHKLWRAYTESLLRRPILTNMVSSCLIHLAGDAVAQKREGNEKLDVRRFLAYGCVATFYTAPFNHYWILLLERIFNGKKERETDSTGSKEVQSWASKFSVASKMFVVDQLLGTPLCTIECYYTYCFARVIILSHHIQNVHKTCEIDLKNA